MGYPPLPAFPIALYMSLYTSISGAMPPKRASCLPRPLRIIIGTVRNDLWGGTSTEACTPQHRFGFRELSPPSAVSWSPLGKPASSSYPTQVGFEAPTRQIGVSVPPWRSLAVRGSSIHSQVAQEREEVTQIPPNAKTTNACFGVTNGRFLWEMQSQKSSQLVALSRPD